MKQKPIIIFGLPRSGTTWLAKTLEIADGIQYIVEPDNEGTNFLGYYYKKSLERFPYFRIGEQPKLYLKLFDRALYGDFITYESPKNNWLFKSNLISLYLVKKRLAKKKKNRKLLFNWDFLLKKNIEFDPQKRRLIKTVHGLLNIPFLLNQLEFTPLIILRHPAASIYSHLKLGISDADQDVYKNEKLREDFLTPFLEEMDEINTPLSHMGMQFGIFHFIVSKFIKQYNYKIIFHEELCENPVLEFEKLYKYLDLKWGKKVKEFINNNNVKGSGGFDIKRIASEEKDSWKTKWKQSELDEIEKGYSIFSNNFYDFD